MVDSHENDTFSESPVDPVVQLETDMIDHISGDQKVFYKSQQINDPELTADEKIAILKEVLSKSHTTFLARFGLFIKLDHLKFFELNEITTAYSPDERYEVEYYLERIRRTQANGKREARNRRYAALKQLVQEGQYFSESEMMQREPLLYEQLVGQYMTEKEKKARDAASQRNDSLVTILFNGMDRENADLLRRKQETDEKAEDEGDDDWKYEPPKSPAFSRAQWGNFDDEEEARQKKVQQDQDTKRRNNRISIPVSTLTSGEKSLLRDEFVGTMYSRFVAGEDSEFDYSKIDESTEFDNLDIVEQDAQERYFDTDDDGDFVTPMMQENDTEEDDLDVYMRHLNQHLENQNKLDQMSFQMRDVNCEYDSDE